MKAANVANTLGSGRARSAGGSAGSTSTRPATVSARRAAWRIEISPPIELPIRIAGVPATSTRKRCSRRLFACTDVDREPPRVCPNPARSMATTRQVCASVGATAAQLTAEPPRPCTQTTSGAVGGSAEVEVVHRSLEIGPSGLGARGALVGCGLHPADSRPKAGGWHGGRAWRPPQPGPRPASAPPENRQTVVARYSSPGPQHGRREGRAGSGRPGSPGTPGRCRPGDPAGRPARSASVPSSLLPV